MLGVGNSTMEAIFCCPNIALGTPAFSAMRRGMGRSYRTFNLHSDISVDSEISKNVLMSSTTNERYRHLDKACSQANFRSPKPTASLRASPSCTLPGLVFDLVYQTSPECPVRSRAGALRCALIPHKLKSLSEMYCRPIKYLIRNTILKFASI